MEVVLALTSSVLTAIITAYLASRKIREDLEARYDTDLRERRLNVYTELWKSLEPLAKYSPPGPVTGTVMADLSRSLRVWYYETGGIFLSTEARDAYFRLQDALVGGIHNAAGDGNAVVGAETFEFIRARSSALRTGLAHDIGTRRRLIATTA
jgi:hypothetical protein